MVSFRYWKISRRIEALTAEVQDALMSSRTTHQTLTPGRLVLLLQPHSGLTELAAMLGAPDMSPAELGMTEGLGRAIGKGARGGGGGGGLTGGVSSSSSSSGVGPDRVLWFLVAHAPGPLDPPAADEGAAKAAAVALGEWGVVGDGVELRGSIRVRGLWSVFV